MMDITLFFIFLVIIAMGGIVWLLVVSSKPPKTASRHPATHSIDKTKGYPLAEIVCVAGPRQGLRYPIRHAQMLIGRSEECQILLDEPLISRHHAAIVYDKNRFVLQDLESINGVWVGNTRVRFLELQNHIQFQIGANTFTLVNTNASIPAPTSRPMTAPSPKPIDELSLNDYDLQNRITSGGQADVWKARSRKDGNLLVIKFLTNLPYNEADGRYFKEKFQQQVMLGQTIRHKHCVRIYGGDAAAERPYLVEEFLTGGTLRERMDRGMPFSEVVRVIGEMCDGLRYLHQRNIVHRDLSPENVMFDAQNVTRVIDFGLARVMGGHTKTQIGMLVGKPKYMSPEQAKGDPAFIGIQTDLYAVGIMAYEMLTGRTPFEGEGWELLVKHIQDPPPPPSYFNPNIPEYFDRAILTALEKNPAQRFKDAEDMARAFGYQEQFHMGELGVSQIVHTNGVSKFSVGQFRPAQLVVGNTGQRLALQNPSITLGRQSVNPDDDLISRMHGNIFFRDGLWWICELPNQPSANGVFHNGIRIIEPHILRNGDEIRTGATLMKFQE